MSSLCPGNCSHVEYTKLISMFLPLVNFTNGNLKQNSASKRIRFGCYQWADRGDKRKRQRKTVVCHQNMRKYFVFM